jgi:hypothetical protein
MEINKNRLESILSDFKKGSIDSEKVWELLKKNIDLDEDLAICQMRTISACAEYENIDIQPILEDLDLISEKYAQLAVQEDLLSIATIIFDELRENEKEL